MCSSRVDGFGTRPLEAAPDGARRAAMALAALSGDEQCIIFVQLCNTLDPGVAVAFASTNSEASRARAARWRSRH